MLPYHAAASCYKHCPLEAPITSGVLLYLCGVDKSVVSEQAFKAWESWTGDAHSMWENEQMGHQNKARLRLLSGYESGSVYAELPVKE